jgi:hypothetical protein
MGLFQKKDKTPAIYYLLNGSVERMKEKEEKSFYYALFDNEMEIVKKWCKTHNFLIELDHITDGNKIYKFKEG